MAQYVGEIRMASFKYAPKGWLMCDGQQVSIYQYNRLFEVIGTRYGGDGKSYFNVPDMRGRAPLHPGKAEGSDITYTAHTYAGNEFAVLHDMNLLTAESATNVNQPATGYTNLQPSIAVNFIISCTSDY